MEAYDAVVVGSGPNGLAAAIAIARTGRGVLVLEAEPAPGGGARSAELTLPGIVHDVCSAIHPLGLASPFFSELGLERYGLEWIQPPAPLAHPFDDGTAAVLERSIEATGETIRPDGRAWRRMAGPMVRHTERLLAELLGPLRVPRHPVALARFGLRGLRSASGLAASLFEGERARGLFAGAAAHSMLPLDRTPTAAFALMLLVLGHAVGWPLARGGSQHIVDALLAHLLSLGGEIACSTRVSSLDSLPPSRAVLLDVTPRQIVSMAEGRLPPRYLARLARYRYGPGLFKLDWALDGPVPWRAEECLRAATVHIGGTIGEIAAAEEEVSRGGHPERPFVILAQQSLFDPARVPAGRQAVWGYCHVPPGSTVDMTERIEAQIERFAPGFRERILARHVTAPADLERHNANYVGGDVNGGIQDLGQLFTRPVARANPYTTPARDVFICSASTPPGGGVHGMCGYHAARAALRRAL